MPSGPGRSGEESVGGAGSQGVQEGSGRRVDEGHRPRAPVNVYVGSTGSAGA
jgi:hypothetical protein